MELKQFVKETLLDVFEAVQEAGTEISNSPDRRGAVVPIWGGTEHAANHEQKIKFDVAVTAGEAARAGDRGRIKVLGLFEMGGQASTEAQSRAVSRVSFSVPVAMPGTAVTNVQPAPRPSRRRRP